MTRRREGNFLRLLLPVANLSPEQVTRAVAVASKVETKMAGLLASGEGVDRLLDKIETYFPDPKS